MGLISPIVTLPLTAIRGMIRLTEAIRDQAEQQTRPDSAAIRGELERIAEAAAAGELSELEKTAAQREVFHRMVRYGP
ncbi:gas vesicle protein GvpG [Nocardia sp. CA-107356]|uniref:gas vesicle protein GvpG n=1 Tax=Nocardia sp. CA-107356 TaxID=3239972 RepID=UPI003D8F331D